MIDDPTAKMSDEEFDKWVEENPEDAMISLYESHMPNIRVVEAYRYGVARYPWKETEVGESFFVRNGEKRRVIPAACMDAKRNGRKYTTKTLKSGILVTRIK